MSCIVLVGLAIGGHYCDNNISLSVIQGLFIPHFQFIIITNIFGSKLAIIVHFNFLVMSRF